MGKDKLIDEKCANDGDCSTCEKHENCSNAEAQQELNRALEKLRDKPA